MNTSAFSRYFRPFFAWFMIGIFYIYQYMLQSMLSVIRPEIQDHFSANAEQFGILTAAFLYAYALVQMPAGLALDRYGPRWIMTIAIICCASGCYLFGHTESYTMAVVARVILGTSSSFAFLGCLTIVAMLFDPKYYALMAGVTLFLGTFGAGVAQNETANWVAYLGSWQKLFDTFAIVGFFLAGVIFILVPSRSAKTPRIERSELSMGTQLWQIVSSPYAWITGIYASLIYVPAIALGETRGFGFLIEGYGLPEIEAYQIVPKIFFGLSVGAPIYGYMEGPFWTPFLIIFSNIVIIALFMIMITPSIAMTLSVSYWSALFFWIGFMCCGLVFAYTRIKESHPKEVIGTATGFIHGINAVCGAISQQLMGRVLDDRLLKYGRDVPNLEDYLLSMDLIFYWLIACLPFGLLLAFIKPKRANLIIQPVTEKELHEAEALHAQEEALLHHAETMAAEKKQAAD